MAPETAADRGLSLLEPLEIRDLPDTGLRFDEALPGDALARLLGPAMSKGAVRFSAVEPGRGAIEVQPLSPEEPPPVRVHGEVTAVLESTCVRCLEAVRVELRAPVETSLFPDAATAAVEPPHRGKGKAVPVEGGEALEPWGESFVDPERLDDGVYDGARIPLVEILSQALLLELPADPACAEVEACDARTAALIEKANADVEAASEAGDPRWAALRALRDAAAHGGDDHDPSGNR